MKARTLWLLVLCALVLGMNPAAAQQDIQYQRRGNRSEGIKPKPVSGYDVELLSALVDTQEDMSKLGAMLGFRFFLKEPASVYPLVRELEYKHYYVLDNVQPATAWQVGYGNVFEWPTGLSSAASAHSSPPISASSCAWAKPPRAWTRTSLRSCSINPAPRPG